MESYQSLQNPNSHSMKHMKSFLNQIYTYYSVYWTNQRLGLIIQPDFNELAFRVKHDWTAESAKTKWCIVDLSCNLTQIPYLLDILQFSQGLQLFRLISQEGDDSLEKKKILSLPFNLIEWGNNKMKWKVSIKPVNCSTYQLNPKGFPSFAS